VLLTVTPFFHTENLVLYIDVYNKIDAISLEQMDKLARSDHAVVISCEMNLKYSSILSAFSHSNGMSSLDYLIDRIWEELELVKLYTKKRGAHPDLTDPVCLRKGATVEACFLLTSPC
jgi:ribosome-interacting GTPase 1